MELNLVIFTHVPVALSKLQAYFFQNPFYQQLRKAQGFDETDVSVTNQIYKYIKKFIFRILGDSIKIGVFLKKLISAKATRIFTSGKNEFLTNYKPTSVFPCFSKILESITCNRLYEYQTKNNLLFDRKGHSTEHALIEFEDSFIEMTLSTKIKKQEYS